MVKKLLLLAAILCCSLVGRASALELTYWCPFSGGDGEFMKEMVDAFNTAHPDIKVTMLNLKSEEYYAKFRTAAISGRGPDVAIAHISQLAGLVADKALVPLDEIAPANGLDWADFADNVVEAARINGKHMGIPLDTHTEIVFFNKKLIGDAGLLNADGGMAMEPGLDGFMKYMADLKAKLPEGVAPFGFSTEGAMPYWVWWGFFRQLGGELFSADGKSANMNSREAKDALNFLVRLVDEGYFPKGVKRAGEVFKNQTIAMIINGIWATGEFEATPGLEFGVAPIPTVFKNDGAWADAHTFSVVRQRTPDAEKEKAAIQFVDWVTEHSLPWAKAGQIPARKAVIASAEYKALPNRADPAKLIEIAQFLPNSEKINAIRETCMMYINAAVVGQQGTDEALDRIQNDVNRELSR